MPIIPILFQIVNGNNNVGSRHKHKQNDRKYRNQLICILEEYDAFRKVDFANFYIKPFLTYLGNIEIARERNNNDLKVNALTYIHQSNGGVNGDVENSYAKLEANNLLYVVLCVK